jgi:plastocyanin
MFDYSTLWDGNSLSPEWTDDMRTPAGIQSNNPLGYALFNSYIGDVISKPSLTTIRSIFQDGDVGDPTIAGSSGYVVDSPIPLTANFTVASNTATLKLNIAPDVGTEGSEILQLALDNGEATQTVTINDTSITPAATYSLSSSAASVNEGSTLTITLTTTGVSDAVNVPYTISGVTSADISDASLTGNLTVTNGTANVVLTIAEDTLTEGTETLVFALDNGNATQQVTINDTSVTPSADYTITVTASDSSNYTLSGTDRNGAVSGTDPGLNFNNGDIIDFNVNANGHPFWIKTAAVTGTGSQATGVTNGGTQSGTVRWIVGDTGTFYYICQYHSAMVGTITVS